mgnify:CR=1 FL=1
MDEQESNDGVPEADVSTSTVSLDAQPPSLAVSRALGLAQELRTLIEANPKQYIEIINGRPFLKFSGWQLLGVAHGCTAITRQMWEIENGFRVQADVVDHNGMVRGSAISQCVSTEPRWGSDPYKTKAGKLADGKTDNQRLSMAQTRACAKALRSLFGWIAGLAGYAETTAEEMHADASTDAPICPVHKKTMRFWEANARYPATWKCPAKLDDGTYCKEKLDPATLTPKATEDVPSTVTPPDDPHPSPTPPEAATGTQTPPEAATGTQTPPDAPLCPVHGKYMRFFPERGNMKPAWKCVQKTDGKWCTQSHFPQTPDAEADTPPQEDIATTQHPELADMPREDLIARIKAGEEYLIAHELANYHSPNIAWHTRDRHLGGRGLSTATKDALANYLAFLRAQAQPTKD